MDKELLNDAIIFATEKHRGQYRKGTDVPYIVHPLEVMTICMTMTDKTELLIAALLHDTIEDVGVSKEEIAECFGSRVAEIVASESEDKQRHRSEAESWKDRKEATIKELVSCDTDIKIVTLSDKLANLRSIYRDKKTLDDKIWQRFNVKDPALHKWYYSSIFNACPELSDMEAYEEYAELLKKVF